MSATSPTPTESPGSAPDNCPTCQHPWAVHDAIGKRWCAGTEVLWTYISEADPSTGQVNCAIEPSKSNALARLLYQNNC